MKNALLLLILFFTLSILSTKSDAKDLSEYGMIGGVSEEGIIKIDLPLPVVENELKGLLLGNDSLVKNLDFLKIDPIKRTLAIKGDLELPESILLTLEEKAGDSIRKLHSFNITITFPSAALLSASSYVQFRINKFVLDGVDYTKGFHIISRIVPALLVNRSLINYFIDETKAPTDFRDSDLSLKIKNFIDSKAFKFRDDTISVRFKLSEFTDLKRFSYLEDLRLWHFSPILIKGTKDKVAFRIEAGLGKPGPNWIAAAKERQNDDASSLKEVRAAYYEKFSYNKNIETELKNEISQKVKDLGLTSIKDRFKNEIDDVISTITQRGRKFLSAEEELFVSDPQLAFFQFKKEATEFIQTSLFKIKQRKMLDEQMYDGGVNSSKLPLATKRFSQNAINQFTNFFRDFEFDNVPLFESLNVVLAPQLPGVIIRGEVNLNINTLFEMGLEGEGINFAGPKIGFDEKTYGNSLPFELSLYTYMQDMSVVELDIKGATIGSGNNRVILANNQKNGDFLAEFTKMAIVNILKTYLISDPLATTATVQKPLSPQEQRAILFKKIEDFKEKFLSLSPKSLDKELEDLITLKALELNNPFNETPAQVASAEIVEFFNNILDYDRSSGRMIIRLDSKIFSEKILNTDNEIAIWNFEPIFDKKMDKTFLELSVGDGVRSKKYLDYLENRQENIDSQNFTGTSGNIKNEGIIDYNLKIDLNSFELLINKILQDSINPQIEKITSDLSKVEEGDFSYLEDLTLNTADNESLALRFTLTSVEKKKKNILRRIFSNGENFEIVKNRSTVNAKIKLSAVNKNLFEAAILKKNPSEVFLGSTLIKLDLEAIGRTIENPGILGKVMNKMIGDVNLNNTFLGLNLKSLILKIAGPFLNKSGKENENTVLGGFHLNNYAKIFTHEKEILIQLNPRFAGPVWDFYIAQNMTQNERKIGLQVNRKTNEVSFDFKSAFVMSTVDKIELYKIMKEANEIRNNFKEQLTRQSILFLYDKLFYNSDASKRSLYHRFTKVLSNYDDLVMLGQLSNEELDLRGLNYTSAGAELMHVAITAKALHDVINDFSRRNDYAEASYETQMIDTKNELNKKYIQPMTKLYEDQYSKNNLKIIKKKVTDWNYLVYPDAAFAQKAYEYIKLK